MPFALTHRFGISRVPTNPSRAFVPMKDPRIGKTPRCMTIWILFPCPNCPSQSYLYMRLGHQCVAFDMPNFLRLA